MQYKGIGFNSEWVASKSLSEFKEHEQYHGLNDAELKQVHQLCKQKHRAPDKKLTKEIPATEPVAGSSDHGNNSEPETQD
jgi:hypothetical protein